MKLITTLLELIERGLSRIKDLAQKVPDAVIELIDRFPVIGFLPVGLPIVLVITPAILILLSGLLAAIEWLFGPDIRFLFALACIAGSVWYLLLTHKS